MTETKTTLRMMMHTTALGLAAFALGGCLGNSSGGGAGPAPGAAVDNGNGGGGGGDGGIIPPLDTEPTSNMPVAGTASYLGGLEADLNLANTETKVGDLQGDVALTLDFANAYAHMNDPTSAGVISASVTNLRGTRNGEAFTMTGEMTTASANANGRESKLEMRDMSIFGGSGLGALTSIRVDGQGVDQDGVQWNGILLLSGTFRGDEGAYIDGPASGTASDGLTDLDVKGNWRADKQ